MGTGTCFSDIFERYKIGNFCSKNIFEDETNDEDRLRGKGYHHGYCRFKNILNTKHFKNIP